MVTLVQKDPGADRRRRIGETLLSQGTDTSPVQHWTQALARVLQGYTGNKLVEEADTRQSERETRAQASIARALSSGLGQSEGQTTAPPPNPGAMASILAGNPDTAAFGLDIAASQMPKPRQSQMLTPEEEAQKLRIESEKEALASKRALELANRPLTTEQLRDKVTIATAGRPPAAEMPPAALKMQDEHVEALGIAKSIQSDLSTVQNQIESGKIDLGLFNNFVAQGRNYLGRSTEESRNFASFRSTLEKLRNDSLRLNNGVQTEGDAQRAWNELFASLNDKDLVSQRLKEIGSINKRAATLRELQIDTIRNNFGAGPFDFSRFDLPSALGGGGDPEKERLYKKYGLE